MLIVAQVVNKECQDATSFPSPTAEMLSGCLGSDPKKGGGRVNGGTELGPWGVATSVSLWTLEWSLGHALRAPKQTYSGSTMQVQEKSGSVWVL